MPSFNLIVFPTLTIIESKKHVHRNVISIFYILHQFVLFCFCIEPSWGEENTDRALLSSPPGQTVCVRWLFIGAPWPVSPAYFRSAASQTRYHKAIHHNFLIFFKYHCCIPSGWPPFLVLLTQTSIVLLCICKLSWRCRWWQLWLCIGYNSSNSNSNSCLQSCYSIFVRPHLT